MSSTVEIQSAQLPDKVLAQIPKNDVCTAGLQLAQQNLHPAIFNHSVRVYLLSKWLAEKEGSDLAKPENLPLLFTAGICHDLGTCDLYNGEQRFEVEGADAATKHLHAHGVSEQNSHKVWVAIALHTSSGIAERIDPFTRLVRMGVKIDFAPSLREQVQATDYCAEIEKDLPRLNIEEVLADAVVKQAVKIPERLDSLTWPDSQKHPKASWPGILLRAHLLNPGHQGVNPAF